MKSPDFEYLRPATLDELLAFLADDSCDSQIISGGQSLVPMMNYRVTQPDRLIDINGIDDLRGCRVEMGIMRIGAMTRYVELQHADIDREIPLLARVLPYTHDAIRNRGTVGGSLGLSDRRRSCGACPGAEWHDRSGLPGADQGAYRLMISFMAFMKLNAVKTK